MEFLPFRGSVGSAISAISPAEIAERGEDSTPFHGSMALRDAPRGRK